MSVVNKFNVNSTPVSLNKDFINVNLENNHETAYSSSTDARNAVPASHRKAGLQITYLLADGWFIDQYVGSDINGWETSSNWNVTAQGALDELNANIIQETTRAQLSEKNILDKIVLDFKKGYYWTEKNGIITGHNTYNDLIKVEKISVSEGEKYYLRTSSIGIGHSYYITDEQFNIIVESTSSFPVDKVITIPEGASYLLLNCAVSYIDKFIAINITDNYVYSGLYKFIKNEINRVQSDENHISDKISILQSNLREVPITLTWKQGYIDYTDGVYHNYSTEGNRDYRCIVDYIKITEGISYITNAYFNNTLSGIAFYDTNKDYISGYNTNYADGIIVVPENAVYFRLSNYKLITEKDADVYIGIDNKIKDTFDKVISMSGLPQEAITVTWEQGYIDYQDGTYHYYTSGKESDYKCVKEFITIENGLTYRTNAIFSALAGIAFYDNVKNYISGYDTNATGGVINIPENAAYFRLSNYKKTTDEDAYVYISVEGKLEKDINDLKSSIKEKNIIISCIGDSVTEGMATDGAHTSAYGKEPYPAQLSTILIDKGYKNITVNNYGHGGERLQDVAVRTGAIGCYINEDITIPADGSYVSLGIKTLEGNKIKGTKLSLYYNDQDGNDYNVYLTQTSHDTNPCLIDGVEYIMNIADNQNYIKKANNDGKETIIPKGSLFFTNNNKSSDVNIIYIGINGSNSITLEQWLNINKICGLSNGGKYIVLGCTHNIWNNWTDIEGSDNLEKYEFYKRKCFETFGTHFIDLYDEFSRHAMDYCLEKGYFSDKTEDEINNMRQLLTNHIIPAEFSYNYNSQGNVHLSKEGYYVIGKLLFERLKKLNYI